MELNRQQAARMAKLQFKARRSGESGENCKLEGDPYATKDSRGNLLSGGDSSVQSSLTLLVMQLYEKRPIDATAETMEVNANKQA